MKHVPFRLLIVEDDVTFRKHLHLMLDAAGFDVMLAWDPEEARRQVRSNVPDVAIVDIMLPPRHEAKSGLDLCRSLHAEHPSMGLMIATVRVDEETLNEARQITPHVVVKTDFDEGVIDRLLDIARARR